MRVVSHPDADEELAVDSFPLTMKSTLLKNITPGEILNEEFLKPMGISQYRLAKDIGVPARRINEIVNGQRAITGDTALRLGRYFRMAAEFWVNLQGHYNLEREQERLGARLEREVKVRKQVIDRRSREIEEGEVRCRPVELVVRDILRIAQRFSACHYADLRGR